MGQIFPSGGTLLGRRVMVSANFTRPSDTTAYAIGDLVANSTTAGSVVPLSWTAARIAAGGGIIKKVTIRKSSTTTSSTSFRLHLYTSSPTCTNGDNGAWLTTMSGWLGTTVATTQAVVFSDGTAGLYQFFDVAGANIIGGLPFQLASGQTLYGLLEARAGYAPTSAEVFTVDLDIEQD